MPEAYPGLLFEPFFTAPLSCPLHPCSRSLTMDWHSATAAGHMNLPEFSPSLQGLLVTLELILWSEPALIL